MDRRGHDKRDGRKPHGAHPGGRTSHQAPPENTQEEVKYIKHLIEEQIPVCIKMSGNQEVTGVIEYYDQSFIRLTREHQPNLFIFKKEIKYIYEIGPGKTKTEM